MILNEKLNPLSLRVINLHKRTPKCDKCDEYLAVHPNGETKHCIVCEDCLTRWSIEPYFYVGIKYYVHPQECENYFNSSVKIVSLNPFKNYYPLFTKVHNLDSTE